MISTEQLVAALEELPPHDRELLELSLRRRVPDEALATLFEVDEADVARRRAGAIERLSATLDLQRGEDLGNVLKSLLENSTWEEIGTRPAPAANAGEADVDADADAEPAKPEPVLGLLADRPKQSAGDAEPDAPPKRRRLGPLAAALGVIAVLAVAIGALSLSSGESSGDGKDNQQRSFVPNAPDKSKAEPFASGSGTDPSRNVIAIVRGRPVVYSKPDGGRRRVLPAKTQFNTPRVFGVVRRQGDWLAIQAPELKNGQVAWLKASDATLDSTPWSLKVDVSKRRLTVLKDDKKMRSFPIAVGSPQHPTPKGRFSVTDKLKVTQPGSPYGCCVLALSGHQVDLPPDWPGGDRLGVHATQDLSSIGKPVSLGCMRAQPAEAKWLINNIPLGSPIYIRA